MNKKYLLVVLVVIVIIILGFFWYLNKNSEPILSVSQNDEINTWKDFSDENLGINFSYPESYGTPKVYKEGDIFTKKPPYSQTYTVTKGKFIIDFPLSPSFVYIEGFNDDYVMIDSSDDPLGYEEYTSCALNNLKNKDNNVYKKLGINAPIYSVSVHEAEGRLGLFGDKIIVTNNQYPSICATIVISNPLINDEFESKLLDRVVSEQVPKKYTNDGTEERFFGKILSVDYLKGLDPQTKESIEVFEKFANSLKSI